MKGIKLIIYYLLQWTWALPQNIIGLCVRLYVLSKDKTKETSRFGGAVVTEWTKGHGSMGLGMFIFMGHKGEPDEEKILVHEYGHTLQSAVLGPLFLFVIGLPSEIWAFFPPFVKLRKNKGIKYTSFYPEKWANIWGSAVTGKEAPER